MQIIKKVFYNKINIYFLDGTVHIYPFISKNPSGPTRTAQSYIEDLNKIETGFESSRGIKGNTILSSLKKFHPIKSTCIDYMHSIIEGLIKSLFRLWFCSDYSYLENENGKRKKSMFSMRQYIQQIDERLLNIKPPSNFPSAPRSIQSWNIWRAHELFYFTIYYSLCVFHGIMEWDYYNNLMLLVIILEALLKPNINQCDLEIINQVVIDFVKSLNLLYPERAMLSGVHELLHLVDCTIDFGPLYLINCFPFEELNRKLLQLTKGRDLIGEEFIKLFTVMQCLSVYTKECNSSLFEEFINKYSTIKTSNCKNREASHYEIKKTDVSSSPEVIKLIYDYDKTVLSSFTTFYEFCFNGIRYAHYKKNNRFADCYVRIIDGSKYGVIKYFIKNTDTIYVLCQKIVKLYEPFFHPKYSIAKSKIFICSITDETFISTIDLIEKTCFIKIKDDVCFISDFKSSHLFN